MGEITEIYICKKGQQLKEGKLEISHSITDKPAAEGDSRQRCREDRSIYKIAYYRLNDNGDFRIFYSYTNPRAAASEPKSPIEEPRPKIPKKAKKEKSKPANLFDKVKKLFK